MKRLLIPLVLSCLLPLAASAQSERLVEVKVLDRELSNPLQQMAHAGRDYIEGQPGHRFAVVLQNLTGERVLAVLSVDGVNAVSGQTASSTQAGYVLEPWQRAEIRGWRKSYSDIAEFYFTALPDSYAARTGRPQNVGVIGVAAFRERRPEPVADEPAMPAAPATAAMEKSFSADAAGNLARRAEPAAPPPPAMAQQLGTGHGQRRYDPVTQTTFERESARPNQVVSLFYDSYRALVARGVMPRRHRDRPGRFQPDPFPIGFVPDPR